MKKIILIVVAAVVIAVAGFLIFSPARSEMISLTAGDNGWDSQRFHNAVAKLVLEHAFDGYELNFSIASTPMNWESMKAGDVDLDLESWTDNYPTYMEDKARGEVVDIGVVVPDSAQGIYVPRYVIEGDKEAGVEPAAPELRHVRDIKKYAHVFPDDENPGKGRIYGAIPGWNVDAVLYKKFLYYGLDKNFVYMRLGSESSIFASLMAAYNLKQPWVGYCYEPTWIAGKLDLVRLEDEPFDAKGFPEGKTEFARQELKIISNNKFKNKVSPEVYSFFQNYRTGSAGVSSALAYLDAQKASHEDTALWFLKNNDSLLDKWLPPKNAEKLRKYLATL